MQTVSFLLFGVHFFHYSRTVFPSWNPEQPEISDLVVQHDPKTLKRLPVEKQEILGIFEKFSNAQAMRVIARIPSTNGFLESAAVDRMMLAVHWEMQRLAEEFYHGHRVLRLLRATVDALRSNGMRTPLARHDGVLSTARAHSASTLVSAARTAISGLATGMYGTRIWNTPAPRVFHALVGFRPNLIPHLRKEMGRMIGELR